MKDYVYINEDEFGVQNDGSQSQSCADRLKEKIMRLGPSALSNRELLSIILNEGIRGKNITTLAKELLERLDKEDGIPSLKELSLLAGMGESKACSVVAMLEFGRRRWGSLWDKD